LPLQSGIRKSVSAACAAFDEENHRREETFEQCCARIGEGADDADLDAKVNAALEALARISDGYRAFHAETTSKVEAYPQTIQAAYDTTRAAFEDLLKVGPGMSSSKHAGSQEVQADRSSGIVVDSSSDGDAPPPGEALYSALFVEKERKEDDSNQENGAPEANKNVQAEIRRSQTLQRSKSKLGSSQSEPKENGPVTETQLSQTAKGTGAKVAAKSGDVKGKSGEKASVKGTPVPTPSEEAANVAGESGPGPDGDQEPDTSAPKKEPGETCPVKTDGTPYFDVLLLSQGKRLEIFSRRSDKLPGAVSGSIWLCSVLRRAMASNQWSLELIDLAYNQNA
jgi:hypothetical protein